MCGRFSLIAPLDDLRGLFKLPVQATLFDLPPRYNVAPSQLIAGVRVEEGERRLSGFRWGLVPFWAHDPKIGYKMINARSETAPTSPAFRAAFRSRRCIIPASGFYEWDQKGSTRQPFYVRLADGNPLAFAGLWEHWEDQAGKTIIESCTILTAAANPDIENLHDRMPVILAPKDFDLWLDPEEHRPDRLRPLLHPAPAGTLTMYPISSYVNRPANEGAQCIAPMQDDQAGHR